MSVFMISAIVAAGIALLLSATTWIKDKDFVLAIAMFFIMFVLVFFINLAFLLDFAPKLFFFKHLFGG